jgi:nicotinamidase-related amidase
VRSTLVVIDVQEGVLATCDDADGTVVRINELIARARQAGAAVVFVRHNDSDDLRVGTDDWQLAAALERADDDPIVDKRYRDGFAETELHHVLTASGAQRLVVTGAHSDYCVQTTTLSALAHGYDITFVADGHATEPDGPELPAHTIRELINRRMATLRYPGRAIEVRAAADIAF